MGPLRPIQMEDDGNRQEVSVGEDGKKAGVVWTDYYRAGALASNLLLCFFLVGEPTATKQVHEHFNSKATRHITFASFEISSEARRFIQSSSSPSE